MKVLVTGGSGFIGTNMCKALIQEGHTVLNLDVANPKDATQKSIWKKISLLDKDATLKAVSEFQPEAIVHLAAETDTDPSKTMDDYKLNIDGTANILQAAKEAGVKRFVLTSTQFVNQREGGPAHDLDYAPHTIYGESKIISENLMREANLETWTIVRPTNIWGPWHLRYPFEFWKVLAEGKYIHPGRQRVVRSYGYVGNVVDQIVRILSLPHDHVNRKTYYVGDEPIDLYDWVNGFSLGQTGRKVRVVPRFVVYSLALAGDLFKKLGIKFPITTSRYRSMTTNNPANMSKTFAELGPAKYSLQQGIDETVKWLAVQYPELVKKR